MVFKRLTTKALFGVAMVAALGACGERDEEPRTEERAMHAAQSQPARDERDARTAQNAPKGDAGLGTAQSAVSTDTRGGLDARLVSIYEVARRSDVDKLVDNTFERADTNADGALTLQEYLLVAPALAQADNDVGAEKSASQAAPASRNAFFAAVAGRDNRLSKGELREAFLTRFDAADENDDDRLSQAESSAFADAALKTQS